MKVKVIELTNATLTYYPQYTGEILGENELNKKVDDDIECPHCGHKFTQNSSDHYCPNCDELILID